MITVRVFKRNNLKVSVSKTAKGSKPESLMLLWLPMPEGN